MQLKSKEKKNKNQLFAKLLEILNRFFFVIAIAVFFIFIGAGYFYLIEPKFNSLKLETETKEGQEKKVLNDLQEYLNRLESYRKEYNEISKADKAKIDSLVAGNYFPEDIYVNMQKIISSRGITLNSIDVKASDNLDINIDQTTTNISLGRIVISLSISGVNYEGLKQLLTIFEENLRLMDVQKVSYSPSQNSASIEINTYYLNK
jgi:Tfp pilus assembly protein PilO